MKTQEAVFELLAKAKQIDEALGEERRRVFWENRVMKKCDASSIELSQAQRDEYMEFWGKFGITPDVRWAQHYSAVGRGFDARYVPDPDHYRYIDRGLNDWATAPGVDDKNYYDSLFPGAKQPRILVRKIDGLLYDFDFRPIDVEAAVGICKECESVIAKPSMISYGGRGIVFWDKGDSMEALVEIFIAGEPNVVVQECVRQHEALAALNRTSVNTVRAISVLLDGEVTILSKILRVGIDGMRVDNATSGGVVCGIDEEGKLKEFAYRAGGIYSNRLGEVDLLGYAIPGCSDIDPIVKRLHPRFGHFQLISWDFAIGEDGEPILLEANLKDGEIDFHQWCNGPLFGGLTERVLEEAMDGKKRRGR